VCNQDLVKLTLQNLVSDYHSLKRPEETERWFRKYASQYEPIGYEWDSEGDRRNAVGDHTGAAEAYEKAAGLLPAYQYDYCYAILSIGYKTPKTRKVSFEMGSSVLSRCKKHE
jgi:tetratricopeptide (TPR) repeat protein